MDKWIQCPLEGRLNLQLAGKTIEYAVLDKDVAGYPRLRLLFDDGDTLEVLEHSQTGEFRVKVG